MRHVVVGTAGHVDHGKTSLVFALTEVQTDRLPEEQRRGITIELGFAPWQISDDVLVSIIDAPGHRRLVHHMIAGASGIDLVLLIVAADEGVMPQTREHVAACKLLGVTRAVVAVTKLDRADAELAEMAAEEARELLEEHGIEATSVLCSSKTGEGIDNVRAAVLKVIAETAPRAPSDRIRLSVDRAFTVHGSGTVVTGTLVEGRLRTGTPLRILAADREVAASARGLHVHGASSEDAKAPTRLAINLGGVSLAEVHRGDVITDDGAAQPSRVLDVWLQALEPIRRGSEASIFIGTAKSRAKIQPVGDTDSLATGGLARLRLTAPLVVFGGDRFVLRGARVDGPTGAVIGGGIVLDSHAPTVRAAKRAALLMALHEEDATRAVGLLAAERAPHPLKRSELPSRFSIAAPILAKAAKALHGQGQLAALSRIGWLDGQALTTLQERAKALVQKHHQQAPLDPGLKLQTLREQLMAIAGPEAAVEVISRLTAGKKPALVSEGDSIRLSSFEGAASDARAEQALAGACDALGKAALSGMTEKTANELMGGNPKWVRALLAKLQRDGEAVASAGLWFSRSAVDKLQTQLESHLDAHGRVTIQEFKEMTGLGRKQSIPLLEYFDREKVTKRDGSERIKGS